MAVKTSQIIGFILIIIGGLIAIFLKQPGLGGIIIAFGLWIGSLIQK